jgi:hypothetical protein
MKLKCTIIQKGQIELTLAYQQALFNEVESFSSLTGTSKNFCTVLVGMEKFHQTNQETFIWLLAMEVAISYNLPMYIFGCKELVA